MADSKQSQAATPVQDDTKSELERLKAEVVAAKEDAEAARSVAREAEATARAAKQEAEAAKARTLKAEREARAAREEAEAAEKKLKEQSDAVDAEVSRQEETILRQLHSQRKVRIIIASGKEPQDRCPVPVAVNGREYLIVRDKEVDVPQGVLNVLDLAVAQVAEDTEEGGMIKTVFRPAQRYSYRVLGYVDPSTGKLLRD